MGSVKFYLEIRKSREKSPEKNLPIYLYFTFDKKRFQYNTGLKTDVNLWDKKRQKVKGETDQNILYSVWRCTHNSCRRLFISVHEFIQENGKFIRYLDGIPVGPIWPQVILDLNSNELNDNDPPLKSKFINIYNQSLEAESKGLDEISGMGFRKSIEHLVKDYAISQHPDSIEDIKSKWLGKVIDDYYDDGDLKDILKRATWLGNDQSHYLKLFEEYDINALKELINLILAYLDQKYKTDKYIKEIQPRTS